MDEILIMKGQDYEHHRQTDCAVGYTGVFIATVKGKNMKTYRCEVGRIDGKHYKLVYDRRGNQQYCDPEYKKEWRWFLWVGGNDADSYVGDFALKREALEAI